MWMTWHLQKIARFPNQVLCRWFLMNLTSGLITQLSLNPSKCQALQVCFKTNPPPHAELNIAWVPLKLRFSEYDLQWDKNINEIAKKANRKLNIPPAAQEVWIQWWWALVCLQMLCQTRWWICWSCLVFLYHCATEENFGTPAKPRVQNHLRTALHYICGCFGDLWAWVSCWEEGRSLSWVCRRARQFWTYK